MARPLKHGEATQAISLRLPQRTMKALSSFGEDRGKAIVAAMDQPLVKGRDYLAWLKEHQEKLDVQENYSKDANRMAKEIGRLRDQLKAALNQLRSWKLWLRKNAASLPAKALEAAERREAQLGQGVEDVVAKVDALRRREYTVLGSPQVV